MQQYWSELTRTLVPYVPGEQPRLSGLLKLNTNECAYPPSPMVLSAIRKTAAKALRLYPDPQSLKLRRDLARMHQVEIDEVFVGNGSDEVLGFAFAALMNQVKPLLLPDVTYGLYEAHCRLFGIAFERVPLDSKMRVRIEDYRNRGGAIVIANPNAPTGIALERAEIGRLLARRPDIPIIIDEAYGDFGAESAVPLIHDYSNLLVVRTFSKSRSLAGLRVGYAIGSCDLITALSRVRDSFNSYSVNVVAEAAARASLQDEAYFQEVRTKVARCRNHLLTGLLKLGFDVLPSKGNFVFARHREYPGAKLTADLRAKAVLIRHFVGERTSDFVRVTVGTEADIEHFLTSIEECLAARGVD